MNIELNEQEANALIQLIDMAVKSSGLYAAEAGLTLSRKIQAAAEAEKKQQKPSSQ